MKDKQLHNGARHVWLRTRNLHSAEKRERIAITLHDRIEVIHLRNITYLKADSNYTHIHLEGGRSLMTSNTLKHFENALCAPDFLRVHNSFIVQACYLKSMRTGGFIVLTDSTTIAVSRARKQVVTKFLKSLMI